MYPLTNKISRSDFLKTSGAALGGMFTLSHYACKGEMGSLKQLMIEGKTNYSLVLPFQATGEERQAAEKLQLFLSKMTQ